MKRVFKQIGVVSTVALLASSCTKDPDSPGIEYMPDMYRSPAIEAYVDNGEYREEQHPELKDVLSAKTPPSGTIPHHSDKAKAAYNMPVNVKAPFNADKDYGLYGWDMYATLAEYEDAKANVIPHLKNPIPYSKETAAEGKELYIRMCSQCHGEKGDGKGTVGTKIGGVANFTAESKETPEGLLYYYMTYGKGQMGAHGMIISRENRWKIVQHLRTLQNGGSYPADGGLGLNMEPVDSTGELQPTVLRGVYFASGSDQLNIGKSIGTLNQIVTFLQLSPDKSCEISGHTDNTGNEEEVNVPLSQDRAQAVKDYLLSYGFDESRIKATGYGSERPIASNDSEEGRAQNRRTEIVIVQ